MRRTAPLGWALAVVALALVAVACGADKPGTITVTAKDYEFDGLPGSVASGTVLKLTNASTREVHELVAVKLADDEKRPVDELLKLPEDQQSALFAADPAMVLIAPPGGAPQIAAVGTGELTAKGRYLVLCGVPTGADPNAYLAAAANPSGGPPNIPGGPPHFANGMYAEVEVT